MTRPDGFAIGVKMPIVTAFPSTRSSWEGQAEVSALVEIAVTADHLGYAHVTCSEHIAVPVGVAAERSS